jgi:hypothetical protein
VIAMRRWLVIPSIAFHIALVIGLLFLGAWHLDKLEAGKSRVTINYTPTPPPAEAAGSPAKQKPFERKPHKEITHDLVVPPETPVPKETLVATNTTEIGTGNGSGSGSGSGEGSGSGTGSNDGPCSSDCGPRVITQTEQKKLLPPKMLSALFTSGEREIQPPEIVRNQIQRDGKDRLTASFQLCLDAIGNISSTKQLKSSGYGAYDAVLAQGIMQWRYRPYSVGGHGIPVCSVVTFIYAMK